jgi:hypothetical protein
MRLLIRAKAVAPIFFNVPEARDQLLNSGQVYTIRRKRKSVGETMAREGNIFQFKELGKVNIELVKEISGPQDLGEYVSRSGFPTAEAWYAKAAAGADHLYDVKLLSKA